MKTLLESAESLKDAVEMLFGIELNERVCILSKEAMEGEIARAYNEIGLSARLGTYKQIAEDFKNRTGCYTANHPNFNLGNILEVGCGSGILSLALAEHTAGDVVGIDLSSDMIDLATENLVRRSEEKTEEIRKFWERNGGATQDERENLGRNPPLLDEVQFRIGSVYDLPVIVGDLSKINYLVCRNALHRFNDTKLALQRMFEVVAPGGKIYIRDLRRDADWNVVFNRIGDERWERPSLVKDYVGAMAAMLTVDEVHGLLGELGIKDYRIFDGSYLLRKGNGQLPGMEEYANEVEFVCIIQKQLKNLSSLKGGQEKKV